jgi:branched-chain amino acid transport system ATP-binding protein
MLLEIEDVALSFAGVKALRGVSLSVPPGILMAIIGPNGAGKTSLINCVSGHYRPDAGRIRFDDGDITRLPPHRIARLRIARTFQNLALFDNMTVLDNLLLGRHCYATASLLSNLFRRPATRADEARDRRHVEEVIAFLRLEEFRWIPAGFLPYGVRKRVELGRALAMEPKLLLLDEPTSGLNREESEDIAHHLIEIRDELGITLMVIEHQLRLVFDLADRVAVLDFGGKIAEGTPREIQDDATVIAAYIGAEPPGEASA